MLRSGFAVGVCAISLAACGGSDASNQSSAVGTSAAQPCTTDVCGTPGTSLTVHLARFDHATDLLEGTVGSRAVTLVVAESTHPLLADSCADGNGSEIAQMIAQWNSTAPMDPFGHVDVFGDDDRGGPGTGAYHRALAALARAGASASVTVQADSVTVATLKPLCQP